MKHFVSAVDDEEPEHHPPQKRSGIVLEEPLNRNRFAMDEIVSIAEKMSDLIEEVKNVKQATNKRLKEIEEDLLAFLEEDRNGQELS